MAPGFCSDRSSRGRFEAYAESLYTKGISSLAIDFGGIGESDDDIITLAKHVDDLKCAIQYTQAQRYKSIGLFGNSLGGLVCLQAYVPDIQTIVTLGGLSGLMNYQAEDLFTENQIQQSRHSGYVIDSRLRQLYRKEMKIDVCMLDEVNMIDQKSMCEGIACPVLMIHGDGDAEERTLYSHSQKALTYLPSSSQMHLIPGAAHGFWGYIEEVKQVLSNWFSQNML